MIEGMENVAYRSYMGIIRESHVKAMIGWSGMGWDGMM